MIETANLEALYQAIVKLSHDREKAYYEHLCDLYDELTGITYSTCASTFEFIKKVDETVNSTQKGN